MLPGINPRLSRGPKSDARSPKHMCEFEGRFEQGHIEVRGSMFEFQK